MFIERLSIPTCDNSAFYCCFRSDHSSHIEACCSGSVLTCIAYYYYYFCAVINMHLLLTFEGALSVFRQSFHCAESIAASCCHSSHLVVKAGQQWYTFFFLESICVALATYANYSVLAGAFCHEMFYCVCTTHLNLQV